MYDTATSTTYTISSGTGSTDAIGYTVSSGTLNAGTTELFPYYPYYNYFELDPIDQSRITSDASPHKHTINTSKSDILTNKYENNSHYMIRRIKEIVPDKVFEFQIRNGLRGAKTIKTVCSPEDIPSLEYACALALAKVCFGDYTLEGIINYVIPNRILISKFYLKEIKHGIKIIKENRRIALLEKEKEEAKARQKKKRAEQKRRRAEKRKNNQIDIIKEAILASKNEG